MKNSVLLGLFIALIGTPSSPARAALATYEVPVPDALREFATYDFNEISVSEKSGARLEVRYQLPLALTGEENHLRFEGTVENGVAKMSNKQGDMTCVMAEKMCRVKYKAYDGLKVDLAKVETLLRAANFTETEVTGRLQVSARFGGDMEGVIYFNGLGN